MERCTGFAASALECSCIPIQAECAAASVLPLALTPAWTAARLFAGPDTKVQYDAGGAVEGGGPRSHCSSGGSRRPRQQAAIRQPRAQRYPQRGRAAGRRTTAAAACSAWRLTSTACFGSCIGHGRCAAVVAACCSVAAWKHRSSQCGRPFRCQLHMPVPVCWLLGTKQRLRITSHSILNL